MTLQVVAVFRSLRRWWRQVISVDSKRDWTDSEICPKQMHNGIGRNRSFNSCNTVIVDARKRNGPQRVARFVCSP